MAPSFIQHLYLGTSEVPPDFLADWYLPWPSQAGLTGVTRAGVSNAGDVVVAGRSGGSFGSTTQSIYMATMTGGVWASQVQIYTEPQDANGLWPIAAFNPGGQHIVIGTERTFQQGAWGWKVFVLRSTGGAFSKTAISLPINDFQADLLLTRQTELNRDWSSLTTSDGKCIALVRPVVAPATSGRVISTTGLDITVSDIFPPGSFVEYPQLLEVDGRLWLFYYGEQTAGDEASRTVLYRTSSDPHLGWSTPAAVTGIPSVQPRYKAAVQPDGSIVVVFAGQHIPSEAVISRYSIYYNRFTGTAEDGEWAYGTTYNPIIETSPRLENQISSDSWYSNQVAGATAGFVFWNARTESGSFGNPFAAAVGAEDVGEPFRVGEQTEAFRPIVAAAADINNKTTVGLGGGYDSSSGSNQHFRQATIGQGFGPAIAGPPGYDTIRFIASSPNRRSGVAVISNSTLNVALTQVSRWKV